jgi:hypothetical protein
MRIYSIYLSTYNTIPVNNGVVPIDITNPANASWMVDWENLFKGDQQKYKRCTLRYQLISNDWTGTSTNFKNFSLPISCNLPSMFHSSTSIGTTLGLIYPQTVPTGGANHCFVGNTLQNAHGVDISIPSGVFPFTMTFGANDTFGVSTVNSVLTGYILFLQFQLSIPIDEIGDRERD